MYVVFKILYLHGVQATRQKPAHFLLAQMAVLTSFHQLFILLGIYNFVY